MDFKPLTRFNNIDLVEEQSSSLETFNDNEQSDDDWSVVSSASEESYENWLSVEQDSQGNIHMSSINDEGTIDLDSSSEPKWEIVREDYNVILSSDKGSRRKLTMTLRAESLAVGVSTVAFVAILPTPSIVLPFLLLSSVDLIKLAAKGRISKLPLEHRDASLQEVMRRLSIKNGQLSVVSLAAATASKLALSSVPIPLILLQQLTFLGLDVSTFELAEKAISGAVCSISSNICQAKQKKVIQNKLQSKDKVIKSAMWGGVSGAAGGVIGPVLNSPIAEKVVLEACAATAKFSEQILK